MKNKFKNRIDTIFGKQVKGRWKKILIFFVVVLFFLSLTVTTIIMAVNVGYDKSKGGFYYKPWEVKIDVKKDIK